MLKFRWAAGFIVVLGCNIAVCAADGADEPPPIRVQAFDLPRYSEYMSAATRQGIERSDALYASAKKICDPAQKSTGADIRACEQQMYPSIIAEARKIYDVHIESKVIGGVQTDVVTPGKGVAARNQHRVLINAHGGGFRTGARFGGQLEAMPLAALGGYKVVAVDYRMGPEHYFPAASVDIANVYRALLKEYDASRIGLYGCSAGGRIVGQTIAWMSERGMTLPGAVEILCSPPTAFGGDSHYIASAVTGTTPPVRVFDEGYFKGVSLDDTIAFPGYSDARLAKFPPTLLMTSTRDYSLSPMVQMHGRLVRLGIKTELHLFDGFTHAQFLNFYIPESRDAAKIMTAFFDAHLK